MGVHCHVSFVTLLIKVIYGGGWGEGGGVKCSFVCNAMFAPRFTIAAFCARGVHPPAGAERLHIQSFPDKVTKCYAQVVRCQFQALCLWCCSCSALPVPLAGGLRQF